MKKLIAPLVLFIFASSVSAAELGKRGKKEYMGACGEKDAGLIYAITNGSNAASCNAAQAAGTERIYCSCAPDGVGGYAWTLLDTALGGGASDLSAYVLLAGDADGQTIQGRTGANAARVDIGEASIDEAKLIGGGATSGFIKAHTDGVFAASPDLGTSFDLYDGGIDIASDGSSSFYGATVTSIGVAGGSTSINGSRVNVASFQTPPTNSNDSCIVGDTIDTATFHYFCAATDTWVRVAMATW